MKRLVTCITALSSLVMPVTACGPFYPYGEDLRFSIVNPALFGYRDFTMFNYSANLYYNIQGAAEIGEDEGRILNVALWKTYCRNKVDTASIYNAVYGPGMDELATGYGNTMITYLLNNKDTVALNYLEFAKHCSNFNTWLDDPWERDNQEQIATRMPLINQALVAAAGVKNKAIQKRYAFLAIRLCFYNRDSKTLSYIYNRYFKPVKNTSDIIDYWALYFRAITDTDKIRQNYNLALVFSNAPDKRFAVMQHYNKKIPVSTILPLARNNKERAAICVINNLQNAGIGLAELQNLYRLQPGSRAFGFLLLREINKLEDWIYTPYYTFFEPSIQGSENRYTYHGDIKDYSRYALSHVEKDRQYAQQLLQFLNTINIAKVQDPGLLITAQAYLQLMTNQHKACLATIKKAQQYDNQTRLIKALCLLAMQPADGNIPGQIKPLIMEEAAKKNNRFLFALARELEYKGNTTEAALLYSNLTYDYYSNNNVHWRTKKNHNTLGLDFYDNYFFYLDAEYTPRQMQELITQIKLKTASPKTAFEHWAYHNISADIDRLYDLLGTKYMRLNKLDEAYAAFVQVNDTVWHSSEYHYRDCLNANPFYTNFYNEHRPTKADTISFTKTSITATLISYLQKAEDVHDPRRDYYYFLAANCYLNMTQYGNSWMMKRYFWTINEDRSRLPDDKEYFQANLAKAYYLKARAVTKMPQFAALCLRMAGRCEKYRQKDINPDMASDYNKYYKKLETEHPDDYDDLMSNCQSFDKYFTRRQLLP